MCVYAYTCRVGRERGGGWVGVGGVVNDINCWQPCLMLVWLGLQILWLYFFFFFILKERENTVSRSMARSKCITKEAGTALECTNLPTQCNGLKARHKALMYKCDVSHNEDSNNPSAHWPQTWSRLKRGYTNAIDSQSIYSEAGMTYQMGLCIM